MSYASARSSSKPATSEATGIPRPSASRTTVLQLGLRAPCSMSEMYVVWRPVAAESAPCVRPRAARARCADEPARIPGA